MVSDQADKTTVYYTPYQNDAVPLYDGTSWRAFTFAELSIVLGSNWAANSNYDFYVINDGGTLRLVTGAAWTSDTARNESLTMVNGMLTNNASMTGRYGNSSTVTVSANRGLYVGTMRTTGSTGTTTHEVGGSAAGGDPGKLYVWNCYNRVRVDVFVQDSTETWTYSTAAYRALNNSSSNRVTFVRGLNEEAMRAAANVFIYSAAGNPNLNIGVDSTTVSSGTGSMFSAGFTAYLTTHWVGMPGLGLHYISALETSHGGNLANFYGPTNNGAVYTGGFSVSGTY
jgi:hypothetical protein